MGDRQAAASLIDVADWQQGHDHPLVDFCDARCPRWGTHLPWQCDPGGGCPKHHPQAWCCQDDDGVVDAQIIPARPNTISWATPKWVVTLYPEDGSIRLYQSDPLYDDEIQAAGHAYESARWFKDHLAEMNIG